MQAHSLTEYKQIQIKSMHMQAITNKQTQARQRQYAQADATSK